MKTFKTAAAALLAAAAFATAAGAFAAPAPLSAAPTAPEAGVAAPAMTPKVTPAKTVMRVHGRRAEVARRLRIAHRRIEKAKLEGRISVRRAAVLHHKERLIRREARFEARAHKGALTKTEVKNLNLKETRLMKAIAR